MQALLSPWSCVRHPAGVDAFTNLQALQTPYYWILWRIPHVGIINYELHFQPLSSIWRSGGLGGMKLQASNRGMAFLVTRPIQEPRIASLEQKMLLVLSSLRKLQGFQKLCQEPGSETNRCMFYYLTIELTGSVLQGFTRIGAEKP